MIRYFRNRCPNCNDSPIFPGLFRMHQKCPQCGNIFEKESGYFIGAMIASYFLGAILALPTMLLAIFHYHFEFAEAIGMTIAEVLILQVFLFRYSRILWIRIESVLTRSIHAGKNE